VVLVVESYRETIQQAVQQVHQEKATQVAQALEVALAVKQVVVAVALAVQERQHQNFTAAQVETVLHRQSQDQVLREAAVVAVEFFQLAT
jgi:hypothetical protein